VGEATPRPFRVLPAVTVDNEHFWKGGEQGELRFLRCDDCGYWIHPPQPRCPNCLSKSISVATASGFGTVHTYTVNHQPWYPNLDPPYVVAIIALDEQDGLRLTTNLVDIEPDDVAIGLRVAVTFEQYDDVWIPFFRPAGAGDAGVAA
jgi:uncharacterized OB-fold protein